MIRLWESTEKNFKGNKWILNECSKCDITEIINGEFTLDLEYPLQDTKGISKYLVRGNIITCPVRDGREEQQFRIRKVNKTSSKVIVYAEAKLIADLKANRVRAVTIAGKTRRQAIQYILDNTLEKSNFTSGSLDTSTNNDVVINIAEGSALEAVIGSKSSILSEYGGEFIINNNTIDIVDSRGNDNGFTIAYGKNIKSIKETTDDTDLVTALIPKSGDYRLPEYVIKSPKVSNYEKMYFKEVSLNLKIWDGKDQKGKDEVTETEAYTIMRNTCMKMFKEDRIDQINFNYSVDLVTLEKTEEYKEYTILESANLGDRVKIKHKLLNVDLIGRVNKTIYNVLLDKYSKLEIGFAKQDIADIINTAVKQIDFAKQQISLKVDDMQKALRSEIKLTGEGISQKVSNLEGNMNSQLSLQDNKINAVVQSNSTGMGWELNHNAFVVACSGASESSVTIDKNGLTVEDGKFKLKHEGDTVFKINTHGVCTADGGFIVEDGETETVIDASGIQITNEKGYTGTLTVNNRTELYIPDDLRIGDYLRVDGKINLYNGDLTIEDGTLIIGEKTLKEYIDDRISKSR